ncbi:hypothetical protein LCGC14_3063950, partial [marine sediment metagenome]
KALTDTVAVTDQITTKVTKSLTDTVAVTDETAIAQATSLTDTVAVTDQITTKVTKSLTDSVAVTDEINLVQAISLTDTIAVTDQIDMNTPIKALTETVSVTDQITTIVTKALTDTVAVTEREDINAFFQDLTVPDRDTGDGDWDDFTSSGAIVRLEDSSSNLLASGHPFRIGQGLSGFYFASGVAPFNFSDSLFVSLVGNPITFNPQGGVSSSVSWTASISASSTEESLESDLLDMMSDFESELNDFIIGDLLTSTGLINISTGRTVALEAFNLMETAAPNAFAVSQALISLDFDPPPGQLQGEIDTGVSQIVNDSVAGLSEAFGIAEPFIGFAIAIVFSAILGMIVSQTSE